MKIIPNKHPCLNCKGKGIKQEIPLKIPIKDKKFKVINEVYYVCLICKKEFTTELTDMYNLSLILNN
jgi:hypothetical protein